LKSLLCYHNNEKKVKMERVVRKLTKNLGEPYSSRIGIDLESKKESEIFKWFLASLFFGKRISENIAMNTYRVFTSKNIYTPDRILKAGWEYLVELLDEGSYTRYDFSTATKLLELTADLKETYGTLTNLHNQAKNSKDLELKLQEFKGIGPTTTNIFLRELRVIWPKADPEPCSFVRGVAKNLNIDLETYNRHTKTFVRLECALLRLWKTYCRKNRCNECGFDAECKATNKK